MTRQVDEINALARRLHGDDAAATAYTLGSLAEHVDEVRGLLDGGDDHWKAEATDIIIHALTLLRRGGVDEAGARELLERRLARFKFKISEAIKTRG